MIYSYDYLTEKPVYRCERKTGSGEYDECTSDEICAYGYQYYVDWQDIESLDNWVDRLDLMCKKFEK